ncbi:MAG: hypothetical protein NTX35_21390 [Verrucomicrobia bacterium]|nr:hypothetical protein [Verrucomicrobiota bacterium]
MKLFFVCNIASDFKSFVPTILFFLKGGHDVSVYLARRIGAYIGCGDFLEEIKTGGGRVIFYDGSTEDGMYPGLLPKGKKPLALPVSGTLFKNMHRLIRVKRFFHELLAAHMPEIVFLSQEDIHYLSPLIVLEAQALGIGALVIPFVMDNPEGAAEEFSKKPDYLVRSILTKIIAKRYPSWVIEYKGREVFHVPPMTVVALEWLKLAPISPWSNACSFAHAVVVEGSAVRSKDPHARSKSRPIGSLTMDAMHEIRLNAATLKAQLLQEVGLDPSRPFLLCALPPNQFNTNREGMEFESYIDVIQFCLAALGQSGWQVIVNLHPRTEAADFGLNTQEHPNIKVSTSPIWRLIALCDVYLSFTSATIRWAIACGTPVINYDVYRYHFDDYRGAPGVVHTDSKQDFVAFLNHTAEDSQYLEELKAHQQRCAPEWGCLDGRSHERLLALCDEVLAAAKKLIYESRTYWSGPHGPTTP